MKKIYLIVALITQVSFSQVITLKHNIGNNIVDQIQNYSCGIGGNDWARVFELADFGIAGDFEIDIANVGIQSTIAIPGPSIIVKIYTIDEDFPASFSESNILGSSDPIVVGTLANVILPLTFSTPVIVPAGQDRILVEVHQEFDGKVLFLGGTSDTYDYSWYKIDSPACSNTPYVYKSNYDLNRPDLNYYITVSGTQTLSVENFNEDSITLTPNPVINTISIEKSPNLDITQITIFNINGQAVMKTHFNDSVDISHLPAGFYILILETEQGNLTKKIIKT
ncbi:MULTISPECIES: T9SS type A sorting domain-containing protein [Aequorivita]|uniref:T9SS type A sorting domain-containing protein n=1 Tax=Aequorivita iocasae TaxID=2803865 RepID=A0ABX7DNW0_9FLAO|nr:MULTISPECIES: T9SS type A sorting domain-containing protein [Aequorivita]QQX75505.1 T9SS type A sorting domain-containing protein [Aequorivita iocasae]UCA54959.1 T9SS type A sorting domain-containing protein [Aequorivita sp. F7]